MAKTNQAKPIIQTQEKSSTPWNWIAILATGLLLFIYAQTANFSFAGDDPLVLDRNDFVKTGIPGLKDIFTHSYLYGYSGEPDPIYRPLPLASYAIEKSFWGMSAKHFHVIQLLLYMFCCYLVYYFCVKHLQLPKIVSLIACLIFVVHPLHTEVVANLKSRDELLAGIFILLSLIFSTKEYLGNFSLKNILGACFLFLALLSKESSLSAFILIPIHLMVFQNVNWKTALLQIAPHVVFIILYFILVKQITVGSDFEITAFNNSLAAIEDHVTRISTAIVMLGMYIGKFLFPYPLSYDYSINQIPAQGIDSIGFILVFGLLLFGAWWIGKQLFKKSTEANDPAILKIIAFGLLFFFVSISITSNIVFLIGSTFAERFMFVPSIGLSIAFATAMYVLFRQLGLKEDIYKYGMSSLCIILAIYAQQRTQVWRNDSALFQSGIHSAPNSARTNQFYGKYFKDLANDAKDAQAKNRYLDSAAKYYTRALNIYPKAAPVWQFLGFVYKDRGNKTEQWNCFRKAIEVDSTYFPGYMSLGASLGAGEQYAEAIQVLEKARSMRREPLYDIEYNLAYCYRMIQRYPEAIAGFQLSHSLDKKKRDPIDQLVKLYRDDIKDIPKALEYNAMLTQYK